MGLDISYYRKLTVVPDAELDKDGDPKDYDNHVRFGRSMEWSESVWPGRNDPLEPNAIYSFVEKGKFHAGSYSGYGSWRRQLAEFANGDEFHELIDFSDNEGTIGPIVSAKLAEDFERNQKRADDHDDEWFRIKYREWRKAFETAADSGAVDFL